MPFKVSAPGSLMLLGEYAVLHGKQALVAAIDKRMTVTLTPRQDQRITISSALGFFETHLATLTIASPFQFVLAILQHYQHKMTVGCDITIESEFSAQVGFGSSAAVTVATLTALRAWLYDVPLQSDAIIRAARKIIRHVQGTGSGADIAAAVLGGVVSYRMQPLQVEKFSHHFPLTVIYSGSKTTTPVAIGQVTDFFKPFPALFKQLCASIDACVQQGIDAMRENNWEKLGNIMNVQQGLMEALQVNTPVLQNIITALHQEKIMGAKISGSGLGDCVIAIGETTGMSAWQKIPVTISNQGVCCEQI